MQATHRTKDILLKGDFWIIKIIKDSGLRSRFPQWTQMKFYEQTGVGERS
jgi:hypothetical protein